MITTTRRIFAYWLLLLVAALGVGAGAWLLLRREESRLVVKTQSAEAARRAAVEARASLVAENIELLVGDVEDGLIDTLAEAPQESLDAFLGDWERTNPLVRTAFRATPAGRLLRPTATGQDEGRGFYRRFGSRLLQRPPWVLEEIDQRQAAEAETKAEVAERDARRKVESNVSNLQSARREVQALAKDRSSYAPGASPSAGIASASPRKEMKNQEAADAANVYSQARLPRLPALRGADRRGWSPELIDGRLHLLGWVWPAGAEDVRGVEVEMASLVSRLGGALPADVSRNEGYALRDERGRVQHQTGYVPGSLETSASVRVPIASALLPGWDVVAFLPAVPAETGILSFFWIGTSLAAVLVLAIVASGSLLLRQARKSEAEAAQKTSFVANVSHEFKTPLTTIRLYSELLEQGRVRDEDKQAEYLGTIGRETQRLARLVNNALDFSRLEQGRKKFQRQPCDLKAELARFLDAHEPRLADGAMHLKRDLPDKPLSVVTDCDAVEQITLNLLDNACKYADSGGEILVTLIARDRGAEIRVADRGPGVPTAERERIFEKFHRVDDRLTAEKNGAGLGLSIARQLARGLGGDLRCEARPGGGAEFVLTLP